MKGSKAHPHFSQMAGQHDLHHLVSQQRERQGNGIREDKTADYERIDNS
nr:hypothetical protein [uncultured Solobacterium sp.]